jgi:hypothetical protein
MNYLHQPITGFIHYFSQPISGRGTIKLHIFIQADESAMPLRQQALF